MLKITYFSHSCFLLDDGKYRLIIDPFFSGNPNAPVKADEIKVDFVALTHGHGDHLGDSVAIARRNNAELIAVAEIANYGAEQGIKAHAQHLGGAWNYPFGRLKFTIAHHGSSSPDGRYMGNPAGLVIKMGGKTIYHAGDTALFLDMKLIGEIDKLDAAFLPIGDNYTMGIDDAVRAVGFLNPGLTVPMHYNTFPVIMVDPEEYKRKVESIGHKCRIMQYNETIEI